MYKINALPWERVVSLKRCKKGFKKKVSNVYLNSCASVQAKVKSDVVLHSFLVKCGLLPLMHSNAALKMMKESLHRIQVMMLLYLSPVFFAMRSANYLLNFVHSGANPPFTAYTSGVKVPCSICMIR